MKKSIIGLLSLGLVFGIGTSVFANTQEFPVFQDRFPSFEEMIPFMQEVHPNWSEEDFEAMYNSCHGPNSNFGPRYSNVNLVD